MASWGSPHSLCRVGGALWKGEVAGMRWGSLGPYACDCSTWTRCVCDQPEDVTDRSYLSDGAGQGNRATAGYFIRSSHWLNPAEVMQQAPPITAGNRTKWILITEIGKAINPGLQCFAEVTDRKPSGDWEAVFCLTTGHDRRVCVTFWTLRLLYGWNRYAGRC